MTTPGRSPTSEMCEHCNNGGNWTGITWTPCSNCNGTGRLPASEPKTTCVACEGGIPRHRGFHTCPSPSTPPSARSAGSVKNVQGGERVSDEQLANATNYLAYRRKELDYTISRHRLEVFVAIAAELSRLRAGLPADEAKPLSATPVACPGSVSAGGAGLLLTEEQVDGFRRSPRQVDAEEVADLCDDWLALQAALASQEANSAQGAFSRSSGETKTEDGE